MKPHYRALSPHGYRALVAEFIDDPETWGGRNRRTYGRAMMRHLAANCPDCPEVDAAHARLRRMRAAYGRRSR